MSNLTAALRRLRRARMSMVEQSEPEGSGMSTNTIAATILEQLGGNRFVAMTGANHLVAESQALTFRLARGGKDRINFVRIELKPLDEYRIDFMRWHRIDFFTIAIREHVQAEDLREVFESVTELRTSLGSMGVRHV